MSRIRIRFIIHYIDLDVGAYWLIYFKHLEFAEKYLEEGRSLVDKDPVQASEKLYKAAEECVKALAIYSNLIEVLEKVKERDR